MQLATYNFTQFHKVVIPACSWLSVYLTGDEEGPELLVFWSDEKRAANDAVYSETGEQSDG